MNIACLFLDFYFSPGCHSHNDLAEIQAIKHPDGRCRRFLQMVYDVLAITDATVGDPRSNLTKNAA